MKNMNIICTEKIKLWKKGHFVENMRLCSMSEKLSKLPCYLHIYNEFLGVFFILVHICKCRLLKGEIKNETEKIYNTHQ